MTRLTTLTVTLTTALTLAVTASSSWGDPRDTVPFPVAELFFELNNTDGDLGIHANIDGEPTKRIMIRNRRGHHPILDIATGGSLRRQGLSFVGFESAEPNFSELSPEEFFDRFPEGDYVIVGRSLEDENQRSIVTITHVMPAPPAFNTPPLAPCDAPVVTTAPVTIDWDPVVTNHPGLGAAGPVEVERYELAIEREDPELSVFIELPPDVTSFLVPAILTDDPGVVKFEVLVKAADGNRTAEESCFEIE